MIREVNTIMICEVNIYQSVPTAVSLFDCGRFALQAYTFILCLQLVRSDGDRVALFVTQNDHFQSEATVGIE